MAKGKNKTLRWARLYVDGYNLSGDSRTISGFDNMIGEVDLSGWSETVRHFARDHRLTTGINGYQAIANDTATTGAYTILNTASSHDVAFLFGGGAAPTVGDIAYLLKAEQLSAESAFDSSLAVIQADFKPLAGYDYKPIGVVLSGESSISSTTTFASVNNGAATTNGWIMQMHIVATSSGDYAFKIEDSADGSSWGDLTSGVFTIDGSAIASETVSAASGTVKQYIRLVATRTAGACTPVCVFSRN